MTNMPRHPAIVSPETVLPPAPPGVRYVRVKALGVVISDDELRASVHRRFHWPMIVLALLILPLLGIELVRELERIALEKRGLPLAPHWIDWVTLVGFTLIWLAFFIEFVVKITIAECRLEYVKRNWLDAIIILVPVLRPLRVAAVAKTSRVFTLRGVGMKVARYAFTFIIGLEATDRLLQRFGLKSDDPRPDPAAMTRHQLMTEIRRLRRHTDAWERWYDEHEAFVEAQEIDMFRGPRPRIEPKASTPASGDRADAPAGEGGPTTGPCPDGRPA